MQASQYNKLDALILAAIDAFRPPLYERNCVIEAERLAKATGRESFRIIDGRLQALRRRLAIVHVTKAEGGGSGGWKRAGTPAATGENRHE